MKGVRISILIVMLVGGYMFSPTTSFQIVDTLLLDSSTDPLQNVEHIIAANYEQMNLSSITLSLSLNETDATVFGNMTIDFYNSDQVAFPSIPFHLYLSGMYGESRTGSIQILNVSALTPSPVQLMFDIESANQLMWIYLAEDLQPETLVRLNIIFKSVLPIDSPDRAGVSGTDIDSSKLFEFASAYPIPCVFDDYDGWNTDPYLATGDPFYLDMAYYNFNLTLPSAMKVAATGKLTGTIIGATNTTYCYSIPLPVREITFCASRYYVVESQIYHGVNVSSYYLPESVSLWSSNGLNWGVRALSLFNNTFGPYPYTTLNIVEDYGFYYGMEYPCQIYLSNLINDRYQSAQITADTLDTVIAHEVAHQWWYHLVGNDEVDVGFLDEGLACWSTYYYSEFYNLGWTGKEDDFNIVRLTYPAKINQSIYNDSSTYYFTAYTKTPVVLEKLRQIIGTTDFLISLRLFFNRFSFRIAFLHDLQKAFEDQLGTDLDWFFIPMFDNEYLPKYAFKSAIYFEYSNQLIVTIEDLNEELHLMRYLQTFDIELLTTDERIEYPTVQLYGTTEIVLSLPESATGFPIRVSILLDDFSLVQLDGSLQRFISTSNITTGPTPSPVTWTPIPPGPWTPEMTLNLIIGLAVGIMVVAIIILLLKGKE